MYVNWSAAHTPWLQCKCKGNEKPKICRSETGHAETVIKRKTTDAENL